MISKKLEEFDEEQRKNWEITYFYGFGEIDKLRGGDLEKFTLERDKNFTEELNQSIIIPSPNLIGIYQEQLLADPKPGEIEEYKIMLELINELKDRLLSLRFGIEDACNRNLIHIIYPGIYRESEIRTILGGISQRIGVSSLRNYPNFFEKDPFELNLIIFRKMKAYGLKDYSEIVDIKPIPTIEDSSALEAAELYEKWLPFGMTRNEFSTLISYFMRYEESI